MTSRLTTRSTRWQSDRRERKDEEQDALPIWNSYSQADSVARHNNTVVAILLTVNSNLRRMQTIENFAESHRETRSREDVIKIINIRKRIRFFAWIFVTNNRRISTRFSAPTFFQRITKPHQESPGQVLVLVSIVISWSPINRSERKATRESSSFIVVATLIYSLFRSTCIYENTDANPSVFEMMICSIIASGYRRVEEIWMGEKGKKEMRNQQRAWWKEIKSPYCNKIVDTDTSIRIMNKPKCFACSRDVTNINNVFFLLCTMVER